MSKYSAMQGAIAHLLKRLPINDGQLSRTARQMTAKIEDATNVLAKLNDEPDPMASPLAIKMRVDKARAELIKVTTEASEGIAALIKTNRDNVQAQQLQIANLIPSAHQLEIRSIFRGLPTGDKLQVLGEAVERGDGQFVAALVTAPSFLSGLTDNQASQYKRMYLEKVAPLDSTHIDETESAANGVIDAANSMLA
jgi:hypothetical protein